MGESLAQPAEINFITRLLSLPPVKLITGNMYCSILGILQKRSTYNDSVKNSIGPTKSFLLDWATDSFLFNTIVGDLSIFDNPIVLYFSRSQHSDAIGIPALLLYKIELSTKVYKLKFTFT